MKVLIQKYGGTSLGTKNSRHLVIKHITKALKNYDKIIVVVSALGRSPEPYATDTLLSLVNYPKSNATKREIDLLISCGEVISSVVLSNELRKEKIESLAITGSSAGIITTVDFMNAKIKYVNPTYVNDLLQEFDVIVVAGFQGKTLSDEVTTIGRGGSDITAAALGASLQAEMIEIYTDVTGVMTADPHIVPKAQPIQVATYVEICNLAYQGAEVIHPRAIEVAMQAKIPIKVKSTYVNSPGTLITTSHTKKKYQINEKIITGIAYKRNLTQLTINLKENERSFQTKVFRAMSSAGISVDFIHISPTKLTYTIPNYLVEVATSVLSTISIYPKVKPNCAKVSVVGVNMTGIPGVVSTIVESLTDEGISILQSADSYTSIWLLIDDDNVNQAVNNLHKAFNLNKTVINKRKGSEINELWRSYNSNGNTF